MEHTMNLRPKPFSMIKSGKKTIELRLYDEKRQKIRVGDTIRFINGENANDELLTKVTELYIFENFDALYKNLPLPECGYTEENVAAASANDMNIYYLPEAQARFGVVGIRIEVIKK